MNNKKNVWCLQGKNPNNSKADDFNVEIHRDSTPIPFGSFFFLKKNARMRTPLTVRDKKEKPKQILKNSWVNGSTRPLFSTGLNNSINSLHAKLKCKEYQLQLEVYDLIFFCQFDCRHVHDAVIELLDNLGFPRYFWHWTRTPDSMLRECVRVHNTYFNTTQKSLNF